MFIIFETPQEDGTNNVEFFDAETGRIIPDLTVENIVPSYYSHNKGSEDRFWEFQLNDGSEIVVASKTGRKY